MDELRNEIEGNQVGSLCIKFPWPELLELFGVTINVTKRPISLPFQANFTGDGALRDEVGYYRITGRTM
jgi:acetyl-CoA synthetase